MSKWGQISIWDAEGKTVFDDQFGFVCIDKISIRIGDYDISSYNNDFYVSNGDTGSKDQLVINEDKLKKVKSLFSKKLFLHNRNYRYYYNQPEYREIKVDNIKVIISLERTNYSNNYSRNNEITFVINKKDKKILDDLRYVWTCDELQKDERQEFISKALKMPYLSELKVDDEVFCADGKHKIVEIYPQPNKKNYMFAATPSWAGATENKEHFIYSDKVYLLPYDKKAKSEFKKFNEYKDEFSLSPYAVKSNQIINVYWNKLEDAAQYCVSLYKCYDRPYLKKIYHLKDYIVDRNDGFVAINDVVDKVYIVTVKAENRSGDLIACSRGIKISESGQCVPQYFEED